MTAGVAQWEGGIYITWRSRAAVGALGENESRQTRGGRGLGGGVRLGVETRGPRPSII